MRDVARSRNRLRLSEEPVRLVEPAVQSLDPRELGEHFGPPGVVRLLAQRGAQPPLCCVQIGEVPEPAQAIAGLCALATAGQNLQGWRDRAREEVVGEAGIAAASVVDQRKCRRCHCPRPGSPVRSRGPRRPSGSSFRPESARRRPRSAGRVILRRFIGFLRAGRVMNHWLTSSSRYHVVASRARTGRHRGKPPEPRWCRA